jgi:PIN domain nuclease of toxin-antitoxin system
VTLPVPVLLDASAVIEWLVGASGASFIEPFLDSDARICAVNLGEVLYKADSVELGLELDVRHGIDDLGIVVVDLGSRHAERFAELKRADATAQRMRRGRRLLHKRLSLADICCLSVALVENWRVLTGDSYWTELGLPLDIIDYRRQGQRGVPH